MARICSVCAHPDRAQIEIGLANGVPLRALAAKNGLDFSQLSRHRTKHMDEALRDKLKVRGTRSDSELASLRDAESRGLMDHFVYQRGRLYANADRERSIGNDHGERQALAAAGKVSERIGNLLGEMGASIVNNTQINLVALPDYHILRTALIRALRPHKDAHADVIAALEHFESRRAEPDPMLPLPVLEAQAIRVEGDR